MYRSSSSSTAASEALRATYSERVLPTRLTRFCEASRAASVASRPYLHDVGWPESVTKSTDTEPAAPDGVRWICGGGAGGGAGGVRE